MCVSLVHFAFLCPCQPGSVLLCIQEHIAGFVWKEDFSQEKQTLGVSGRVQLHSVIPSSVVFSVSRMVQPQVLLGSEQFFLKQLFLLIPKSPRSYRMNLSESMPHFHFSDRSSIHDWIGEI